MIVWVLGLLFIFASAVWLFATHWQAEQRYLEECAAAHREFVEWQLVGGRVKVGGRILKIHRAMDECLEHLEKLK